MASTNFNPIKLDNLKNLAKIAIKNDKRFKKKLNKDRNID
jgi:hypothetical protein